MEGEEKQSLRGRNWYLPEDDKESAGGETWHQMEEEKQSFRGRNWYLPEDDKESAGGAAWHLTEGEAVL